MASCSSTGAVPTAVSDTEVDVALRWNDAGKFMNRFGLPKGVERGPAPCRARCIGREPVAVQLRPTGWQIHAGDCRWAIHRDGARHRETAGCVVAAITATPTNL